MSGDTPRIGDAAGLLRQIVRADSRNPSLVQGVDGEAAVAGVLSDTLRAWGMDVRLSDALPGRPNVIAVVHGRGGSGGRSLMFNGHLDVVGTVGMIHDPFSGIERDGRLFARGAADMKGGVAAMCAAAARLRGGLAADLVIAAVVDEEWQSAGTAALIRDGLRADAAIVTEPTGLRIMPAHKGFVWLEVTVHGTAAHGSRWDLGTDAIRMAALLLAELDAYDRTTLAGQSHPLLGRPSLHAGTVTGGTGLSTYPDLCVVTLERRTLPGEVADVAIRDVRNAVARVRERHPELRADVREIFAQPPSDVAVDSTVVTTLRAAIREHGLPDEPRGMSAWTDAALLNRAGIPAVCFGPGDMGLAHAAEEYIDLDEVEQAAAILERFAKSWCD